MKKKNLLIPVFLVAILLIGTMGVFAKSADDVVIGMTANNVGVDTYQTTHAKVMKKEAEKMGVKLVHLDARGKPMRQINQIQNLIQKNVDVIIVWPVNSQAVIPACKTAKEQGIPVLIANTKISESGYHAIRGFVGPDYKQEGANAAEMLHEALPNGGDIVEITGLPGYATSRERSVGFRAKIQKNEDWNFEIIGSEPADWNRAQAMRVMENFLTKYPSGEIDAVYASDDNLAAGAIKALKAAGRLDEVKIVSACMFKVGYEAIKAGNEYGTCYQSPVQDAKKTVHTAVKLATGEDIPFLNYFETPKITRENIDEFEKPIW